jgi:hypothetical protein
MAKADACASMKATALGQDMPLREKQVCGNILAHVLRDFFLCL